MAVSNQIKYHESNQGSIAECIFDNVVHYLDGNFKYTENESGISSPHIPPYERGFSTERILNSPEKVLKVLEERVLRRAVPGRDGRQKVDNTTTYPYSIHSQLQIDFSGSKYGGSGSMVGPHHVLTCAHNVYDRTMKWATNIEVHPAKYGSTSPFGKAKVVKSYVYKNWISNEDRNFDIALLVLDKSIGHFTGWGGVCSTTEDYLKASTINLTGYPGDDEDGKRCNYMWTMSDRITKIKSESFEYIIDTFGGQSGSALWLNHLGNQPTILGVHTLGSTDTNYGVRITKENFTNLIARFISKNYVIAAKYRLNNGKPLVGLEDRQVGELLRPHIGEQYFSSFHVESINKQFGGTQEARNGRKITLKRTCIEARWEGIRAFFLQLFDPSRAEAIYGGTINSTLVASFVGRESGLTDAEITQAQEDLVKIFNRCSIITLYISNDCKYLDCDDLNHDESEADVYETVDWYRNRAIHTRQYCVIS